MPAFVAIEKELLKAKYLGTAPTATSGFLSLLAKIPTKQKTASSAEVYAQETTVTTAWAAFARVKLGLAAGEGELEFNESEAETGLAYYTNGKAITFASTAGMGASSVIVEAFAVFSEATLGAGTPISYGTLATPLTVNKALTEVTFPAKTLKLGAE